jgi:hypothetical protein
MAKKETMAAIEATIDTVDETVGTLERIPKVNLNGTTKQQQILILEHRGCGLGRNRLRGDVLHHQGQDRPSAQEEAPAQDLTPLRSYIYP